MNKFETEEKIVKAGFQHSSLAGFTTFELYEASEYITHRKDNCPNLLIPDIEICNELQKRANRNLKQYPLIARTWGL